MKCRDLTKWEMVKDEWYSRYRERLQTSGTGKTSPCLGCKLHQSKKLCKNAPNFFWQALCSFEQLKCDLKIISFGKCKDQVCAMVPTKWSIVAQLFGQNGRHAWWAVNTLAVPERSEGTPEFCKVHFFCPRSKHYTRSVEQRLIGLQKRAIRERFWSSRCQIVFVSAVISLCSCTHTCSPVCKT